MKNQLALEHILDVVCDFLCWSTRLDEHATPDRVKIFKQVMNADKYDISCNRDGSCNNAINYREVLMANNRMRPYEGIQNKFIILNKTYL